MCFPQRTSRQGSTNMQLRDLSRYRDLIARLAVGKRLPDAVYVHISALNELPDSYSEFVDGAADTLPVGIDAFNVVKFATLEPQISLLRYGDFFESAFPALEQ